jgi:hypothetical protein
VAALICRNLRVHLGNLAQTGVRSPHHFEIEPPEFPWEILAIATLIALEITYCKVLSVQHRYFHSESYANRVLHHRSQRRAELCVFVASSFATTYLAVKAAAFYLPGLQFHDLSTYLGNVTTFAGDFFPACAQRSSRLRPSRSTANWLIDTPRCRPSLSGFGIR